MKFFFLCQHINLFQVRWQGSGRNFFPRVLPFFLILFLSSFRVQHLCFNKGLVNPLHLSLTCHVYSKLVKYTITQDLSNPLSDFHSFSNYAWQTKQHVFQFATRLFANVIIQHLTHFLWQVSRLQSISFSGWFNTT